MVHVQLAKIVLDTTINACIKKLDIVLINYLSSFKNMEQDLEYVKLPLEERCVHKVTYLKI